MTKAMRCAEETAKYLAKHELIGDLSIYVDHKRYSVNKDGTLKYDIDAEPKEYFEFAGDFLSISFEGELYMVMNYEFEFPFYEKHQDALSDIFRKYGYYYELGNAWNLSLYKI